MGRPRLHDERTERELLAAAERLLAEGGADALSVRGVAEAAGSTTRAVYTVFGGKDGLLRALFHEGFRALMADIEALPVTDDPAADLVRAGVEGFRGWARTHPELFRLVFERVGEGDPRDAEDDVAIAALQALIFRVRRCADAGLIAAEDVRPMVAGFHALCEGLAIVELRQRPAWPGLDPQTVWRRAATAFVAGYGRRA